MNRRNFLAMLGIAPLVAAGAKLIPKPRTITFYQYDLLPAAPEIPESAFKEIADSDARAQAISGQYQYSYKFKVDKLGRFVLQKPEVLIA